MIQVNAEIQKMDAQIRYHMNLDPDTMSDDTWTETWCGLQWILQTQQDQLKQLKNG